MKTIEAAQERLAGAGGSLRRWLSAVGLLGLAIAVASIADMFSARPSDGIAPMPYRTGGIEVRSVAPAGPASQAGIATGDCVLGIGTHLVKSISDASRELRRHQIGETVSYLVRPGPCVAASGSPAPAGEMRTMAVRLSSIRLGGTTNVYAAVLGFLFFFIGLFVFRRRPEDRAAQVFFLLCVLFLLFFVCRLRPASYWWIDHFVQNTGTVSLFLLPAVFLHFFLIFPRPKRLTFAKADEWSHEPPARWKARLQDFLSASPGLFYLIYSIPPVVFLYDVFRQLQGHRVSILSGAPLSSWVLLGDYLILGLLALAHSAFTLEDPEERRQAFHVLVGTILGTAPFVLLGVVLPSLFNNDDYVFYGIVPMILIPLTFAYAIVRFQMMNIRLVVKRTFLYAGTTAILFGLYIAAIATANALFARRLSASPLFNFGFFLVVVPLFELVRRRLQTPLDKLFFREKFDYQAALLEMSEAITGELDLGKITDYLTASVAATMHLEKASIWLRDKGGFLERRGRRDDRLSPEAGVRSLLRREGKPVALEELSLAFSDPESQDFRERLEAEGVRLVVPLVYREQLMGILALKEKLSGERFDREDRALLSTLANQAALAIETALLHDEMTRQAEFRRDLEIARDIQASLLPRSVPIVPGFTLLGGSLPAKVVGGDFYDFIPFEDQCLGVVIGDVSGKSVPASLLMVASKEIVYSRALTTRDPGLLFRESNRRIYSIKRRMFVSLGYFLLDPEAMSLRYAIGGQPLPILLRAGDGGPRTLDPPEHRLPLGAFREVPYDTRELYLKRGDLIFFYTDGFSEAMDEEMNPFGEERLMKSLAAHRESGLEDLANGILADIRRHVGGAEQYDDMTFLFLRRNENETRGRSGRIMRRMSVKSQRTVIVVTGLFLLVAAGVAALYLTGRRDITTSSSAAYEAYQQGVEYDRRFYFKEARVAYAQALALDPNFAMAMLRLASRSNYDQAVSLIERARRLRGRLNERERLFVDMADAETHHNTEETKKLAHAIFDKYPQDVDAAMFLCGIEMAQGHADRALQIYSRLLEADPNNAAVYNQIGYYYGYRGDYDKAIENLKKYQFMAPDQANPYDSLGEIQAYSGHYDEAIANLNKALALKPDFYQSYQNLGVVYEGKGEYARAVENYLKAAQEALNDGEKGGYIGMALRAAYLGGDRNLARQLAERLEALPKDKDSEHRSAFIAALLDLMEGRPAEAERRLNELRPKLLAMAPQEKREPSLKPYFPDWNALMARAKVDLQKPDEAIPLYEEMANPPNPWRDFKDRRWAYQGRACLAELLARKGDLDRAEKLLAENHKWNPSWAPSRPAELTVERLRREKVLSASAVPATPH